VTLCAAVYTLRLFGVCSLAGSQNVPVVSYSGLKYRGRSYAAAFEIMTRLRLQPGQKKQALGKNFEVLK
jgi:hypothetical protein